MLIYKFISMLLSCKLAVIQPPFSSSFTTDIWSSLEGFYFCLAKILILLAVTDVVFLCTLLINILANEYILVCRNERGRRSEQQPAGNNTTSVHLTVISTFAGGKADNSESFSSLC